MKTISPQKIVDYLDRRCDGQTRSMVEEWMARSEENRDEFFRIKQLWALKNTYKHASAPEVEGAVRRINQQLDQRRRIRRLQYLARTAVAAALLFGAVLAGSGLTDTGSFSSGIRSPIRFRAKCSTSCWTTAPGFI